LILGQTESSTLLTFTKNNPKLREYQSYEIVKFNERHPKKVFIFQAKGKGGGGVRIQLKEFACLM